MTNITFLDTQYYDSTCPLIDLCVNLEYFESWVVWFQPTMQALRRLKQNEWLRFWDQPRLHRNTLSCKTKNLHTHKHAHMCTHMHTCSHTCAHTPILPTAFPTLPNAVNNHSGGESDPSCWTHLKSLHENAHTCYLTSQRNVSLSHL